MRDEGDLAVLWRGLTAAGSRRPRLLAAAGVALTLLVLYLLLAAFPGGENRAVDPFEGLAALAERPGLFRLWLVAAIVLAGAIWALLGGTLESMAVGELSGRPLTLGGALARGHAGWSARFAAPILLLLGAAVLLLLAGGLVQADRIPFVGPVLLLLLAPIVLLAAGAAAWLFLRWLLSGHLVGPAIAAERVWAFAALARAMSYLRRGPGRVILLRLLGILSLLAHAAFRAGLTLVAAAAAWWFHPSWPDLPWWPVVLLLLVWAAAAPVSLLFGGRAALYLAARRSLDGVPLDEEAPESREEKTLEELGVELVERLRAEAAPEEE